MYNYNRIQLYRIVYNYIQSYTIVYKCLQSYTTIYNCRQLYTIVYNCINSIQLIVSIILNSRRRWMVTLELLETSLRLSWSPLGVQETSRTSKSDAKSLSAAKLSSKLAFGVAKKNNDFRCFQWFYEHLRF